MICGVNIGGKDTLSEWGLMLCNDLTIGPAVPRYRFITIPEMSGALDLTEALTGSVPYDQRTISFTLFAVHDVISGTRHPATEEHFETVRSRLSGFANGKRMHVYLPDIPDHYFIGRVSVGGKSGFNSGKVKVEIIADPYRMKDGETTLTVDDDDFFKTATPGAIVTFPDGGDDLPMKSLVVSMEPQQDLNGYDHPWAGGAGVNILDPSQKYTYNANQLRWYTTDGLVLKANQSYTFHYYPATSEVVTLYITQKSDSTDLATGSNNVTYTPTADTTVILRAYRSGLDTSDNRYILVKGSTAPSAWSPYSNLCPISWWSGANAYRTGKNIADFDDASLPASTQGEIVLGKMTLKPGTYTLSYTLDKNVTATRNRAAYVISGHYTYGSDIKTAGRGSWTFTIDKQETLQFKWRYHTLSAACTISDFQLELGSSATSYEEYSGTSVSLSFGQTVYGGTVDWTSGTVSVKWYYGKKKWSEFGSATVLGNYERRTLILADASYPAPEYPAQTGGQICNIAPHEVAYNDDKLHFYATTNYCHVFLPVGTDENTEIEVCYILATPTTITLTAQELQTLAGQNVLWSDAGDITELIYMFKDYIIIDNEGMPAVPTIDASDAGPTITLNGVSHVLAAGENRFSDFILQGGENRMQVTDPEGTLTIKWQEGML